MCSLLSTAPPHVRPSALAGRAGVRRGGFTLIELIVVVALIAVAAGLISLSLRDPAATRLEHEAARLSALLESARAESRASGLGVHWVPRGLVAGEDFHFVGLGPQSDMPKRWLDPQTRVLVGAPGDVRLGPEPLIGAQVIVLRLGEQRLELRTDGLGPFVVSSTESPP